MTSGHYLFINVHLLNVVRQLIDYQIADKTAKEESIIMKVIERQESNSKFGFLIRIALFSLFSGFLTFIICTLLCFFTDIHLYPCFTSYAILGIVMLLLCAILYFKHLKGKKRVLFCIVSVCIAFLYITIGYLPIAISRFGYLSFSDFHIIVHIANIMMFIPLLIYFIIDLRKTRYLTGGIPAYVIYAIAVVISVMLVLSNALTDLDWGVPRGVTG